MQARKRPRGGTKCPYVDMKGAPCQTVPKKGIFCAKHKNSTQAKKHIQTKKQKTEQVVLGADGRQHVGHKPSEILPHFMPLSLVKTIEHYSVRTAPICSNDGAFVALKHDGSVVSWGHARDGGDSSSVQAELQQGVDTIFSNNSAFAALKHDGSVVTWGRDSFGGDSSTVQAELNLITHW